MTADFSLSYCPVSPFLQLDELTQRERSLLSAKTSPKRMADFVAGRKAVKEALRSFLTLENTGNLSVLREEEGEEAGKPYVFLHDTATRSDVHVSITHADQQAYATASHMRIGIDNVTIEAYSSAFIEDVFRDGELAGWMNWLGVHPRHSLAICTGFAAKEAFLKWLGTGLRLSLSQIQITPVKQIRELDSHHSPNRSLEAICSVYDDHGMNAEAKQSFILKGLYEQKDGQVIFVLVGNEEHTGN
ncbi:4'-phosphopantetheinyl transferase family protein [Brevibacillus ginsengisoli]|uniref:4'-phosphopantetheinyl transferase family protein n=1 Tax=Brevibacillus ginsengisoli TaxID=363854 RepID=UPI003CF09BA9